MGGESKLQTNFTAERPPWNYGAILDAFRARGQEGATLIDPNAADDVVQSVSEYAGRANLARSVVNFMRNEGVLVPDEDNTLVFFDPAKPADTALAAPAVVAAPAVASAPDASPASDVEATPPPPTPPVVKRPREKARITPAEEAIIAELREQDEVESLYSFLRSRLGKDESSTQALYGMLVKKLRVLVSVRKGVLRTHTPSLHRVDHAALDTVEFVVDMTLPRATAIDTGPLPRPARAATTRPAKPSAKPKPKAATKPARASVPGDDSVEGIRRHIGELVVTRQRSLADAKKSGAELVRRLAELNREIVRTRRDLAAAGDDARRHASELAKLDDLRKGLEKL